MARSFDVSNAPRKGRPPASPTGVPVDARELAQRYAEDVVTGAAVFKPNAPGRCDLSPRGFGQRQRLKARGVYVGERTLLATTPLHVVAIELHLGARLRRLAGRWTRDELIAVATAACGVEPDPRWPAVLLADSSGRAFAELQPLVRDDESARVTRSLLAFAERGSTER